MAAMMRAARLYGVGELGVEEIERHTIQAPDEVLIRTHACGVCPSDLRAYTGSRGGRAYPFTPGHEWAGEIIEVGPEVKGWKVGDRVAPSWRVMCGTCYYCIRGLHNYCENIGRFRPRGGFAEYGASVQQALHRIPDNLSYNQAAFAEPLACCINGNRWTMINYGDDVVVVGAGPIGLLHAQLARHAGGRVIVSEFNAERLAMAKKLGADEVINASEVDPVEAVKDLTHGYGANAVIVAVGARRAEEQALEMAAIGASVNYFAGTYPPTTFPLDPNVVHYKQIRLTGSHDYTPMDFISGLLFMSQGVVKVEELISHELPLDQIKEGFDIVAAQQGLKVMVRTDQ